MKKARWFAAELLAGSDPEFIDDATVCVSEVLGNAVRYAQQHGAPAKGVAPGIWLGVRPLKRYVHLFARDPYPVPREVAELLGVSTVTVGRWARTGVLKATIRTPGGQRRYRPADVRIFREGRETDEWRAEREQIERDAVRLYEQGWSIRRVAAQFECDYGRMRRILLRRTTLRRG